MRKREIGLALGSGAVRGFALIPIIKRLEKEDIKISAVSGSSVGSLVGTYYALYGEIDSFFDKVKEMERRDYLKLADPNNPKISLFKGKRIKKFLSDNFFDKKTFKDTKIPLYVCATEINRKKAVYLSRGKLVDAVMASISIPGILPPYKIGKRVFVDGGVLDPVPTKPLLDKGLKKIVGISLTCNKLAKEKKSDEGMVPALMNTFYMMMEKLAEKKENSYLFLLNPNFEREPGRMLAFYDWEDNYNAGKNLISRKIKDLKKWLDS